MKIYFAGEQDSAIAERNPSILRKIENDVLSIRAVDRVSSAHEADAIILQEQGSFKDFRYLNKLKADSFVCRYADKIFVINTDDCATGLFRGLYTSLPKSRIDFIRHRAVPYMYFPNELVTSNHNNNPEPRYLASWRGNTKSNLVRRRMLSSFAGHKRFLLQHTDSWLNHEDDEKQMYVDAILDGKFSLCPAGWAPVTYRIYESMALGRCPVIIADQFVPPTGPDWKKCALFYPEGQIEDLDIFLQSNEFRYNGLGERARLEWLSNFHQDKMGHYYAESMVNLISTSPPTTIKKEFQKWSSIGVYWRNRWTIPQRIANKARKWSRMVANKVSAF